ncbi:hypothetical protein [Acinetobacter baumannii]|uniref:hypothetical protein n=1 Tax=Acinetobacter baumannii TaxID=470 RepID=UPI000E7264A4|nr:hypothetical protein [Acinetobacter baumannii]RJN67751.1 hypothetical protein D3X67_14665 [Acinetobacter baumannii]HAV5268282.1 hypothetical protein [Acinetobacter baumannii]
MMRRLRQRQRQQRSIWAMLNKPMPGDFKVGDKITTLLCDDILTVIDIGSGNFLKAKGFNCHGMKDGVCNVLSFQVNHATKEEIEAGYRIDKVVPTYANIKFPYLVFTGAQVGAVLKVAQEIDDIESIGETKA